MSKNIKIKITEGHGCGTCDSAGPQPALSAPSSMPNAHNGEEARMHRTTLAHLIADVKVLLDLVQDGDDLPEWLETKITKAGDYMSSAARYIAGNMARDQGQLEEAVTAEQAEQIRPNIEAEQALDIISRMPAEQLSAYLSIPATPAAEAAAPISEASVGLEEDILVSGFFNLYENLQDAVDEYAEKPCPECLYEVLEGAACGCPDLIPEAKYRGRTVTLNKPTRGDVKKFKVYVKNAKGKVVKVNFGHGGSSAKKKGEKTMKIRKSNKKARKSFRARHNCKSPGPKWKARYWSCRKW